MAQARSIVRHGLEMRQTFKYNDCQISNWFPRHMFSGLLQVQGKLHSIDAVVEVHDARIPFTGRNSKLSDIGIVKPSVLVLNKVDLIDPKYIEPFKKRFANMGANILTTNSKDTSDDGVKNLVPTILKTIHKSARYNRAEMVEYNIMVIGVPNVGKSSLINALRCHNTNRKKCAPVAPRPGVTRCVMERIKVFRQPPVFVRDTPGVLAPRIPCPESGIKLALAAIVDDKIIGHRIMADYLLYWLNSRGRHEYVEHLQLPCPTDNIQDLLANIALRNNFIRKKSLKGCASKLFPDYDMAANAFIGHWRKGEFGCAMLDDDQF